MISTSMGPYFCVPMFDRSISGISAILYSVRDFEVAKILLVTDSGAGAPFVRLYLIPKSLVGPTNDQQLSSQTSGCRMFPTSWVMAGGQEDAASGLAFSNNMTCSRCAQYTVLPDQKLLDAVCCADLCDQLHDLGIVEAAISSNDQEASFDAFGN